MIAPSRRTVVALAAFLGVVFAGTTQTSAMSDKDLAQALQAGGYVIVVRHGATLPDQADTDPLNFDNVAAQRNLNDKGMALAREFGESLRRAGIPVGKIYTSKYNRAYETGCSPARRTRTQFRTATSPSLGAPACSLSSATTA